MNDSEIEQGWEAIRWARQYVAEWKLACLLWFAIGVMSAAAFVWITR